MMKANTRYTVEIGQPVIRLIEVDSLEDARALLRACATHHTFLPAMCERDSGEPMDNEWLRDRPIPDEEVHSHFRERVGYWQAALELDDPESHLGAAVIAGLNSYHDLMMDNPLAGEPGRFTSVVAEAARDWADEFYGTNYQLH
jgi:hypothetical protein